ncbi:MAG: DivIVA domain-containing protein [Glycomyces artemisiae]|nr:DivIVA domain-containing protein [Glycomyces artemisiae]
MFTSTRLREGYEVKEVDAFLDRIEAEFERRQAVAARRP